MAIIVVSIVIFFFVTTTVTRKLLKASVSHAVDTTAWGSFRASQEVRNLLGGEERYQEDVKRLLNEKGKTNGKRG